MLTVTLKSNISRQYRDLDLNFNIHPIRKDINKFVDELAVINSIKNLILTARYERLFQPELGSNVTKLLFENMDNITASTIKAEIESVIRNHEPRASIRDLIVTAKFDENVFNVYLEFNILNRLEPIAITFLLERTR